MGVRTEEEPDGAEGAMRYSQRLGSLWQSRATTGQGRAEGTREPGGAGRTTVPGGVTGVRSHNGADWSTGRGGVTGSEARGRTRGSTHQGPARDQKTQGGSEQVGGATKGRAKRLKGASGVEAEELDGIGRGGGRGRLGGTISNEGDLELGGTSGYEGD